MDGFTQWYLYLVWLTKIFPSSIAFLYKRKLLQEIVEAFSIPDDEDIYNDSLNPQKEEKQIFVIDHCVFHTIETMGH